MRDIGKNIKELRQLKNMTQDELAEKLFVTRQTVSNYETGKSRPDIDMLTRIAEVLETDPNTVLYGIPQRVSRQRMLVKLCLYIAAFAVIWVGFCYVSDWAKVMGNTTYDLRLYLMCRIFGSPAIAFLFGWLALQALHTFVSISPVPRVWAKRLRYVVIGTSAVYLLIMLPMIITILFQINLGDYLPDFLWKTCGNIFYWLAGYASRLHINPSTVIFGILGCAFWLGTPGKSKESKE